MTAKKASTPPTSETDWDTERRRQRLKELACAVADVLEERAIARKAASGGCDNTCQFHPEDVKKIKDMAEHSENMKKIADPKVVEAICALADSWRTTQSVKTWATRILWGSVIAVGGGIAIFIAFRVLFHGIIGWIKEGMTMS